MAGRNGADGASIMGPKGDPGLRGASGPRGLPGLIGSPGMKVRKTKC